MSRSRPRRRSSNCSVLLAIACLFVSLPAVAEDPQVGTIESFVRLLQTCEDKDETIGVTTRKGEFDLGTIRRLSVRKPAAETEFELNSAGILGERGPKFRLKDLRRVGIREHCFHMCEKAVVAVRATKIGKEWVRTRPSQQNPIGFLRTFKSPPIIYLSGQIGHIFYAGGSIGEVNGRTVSVLDFRPLRKDISADSAKRKSLKPGEMITARKPTFQDLNGPRRKPASYYRSRRLHAFRQMYSIGTGTIQGTGKSVSLKMSFRAYVRGGKSGQMTLYPAKTHVISSILSATAKETGKLYLKSLANMVRGGASGKRDSQTFSGFIADIASDAAQNQFQKAAAEKVIIRDTATGC